MKFLILIVALISVSVVFGQKENATERAEKTEAAEDTIRKLDDEERRAALDRNVAALERLWSDDFTVNAPNNKVSVGKKAVMDAFVKSGIINFSSYERVIEFIRADGNFAFVFGLEILVPKNDAPSAGLVAGQTVKRRFTNIWKNESGTWRLFARHANVIPTPHNETPKPKIVAATDLTNLVFGLGIARRSDPYNGPFGFPKGAQRTTLSVDVPTGGETYYARFPAATRIELHWHDYLEYAVVLRGTATHFLDGRNQSLNAGD